MKVVFLYAFEARGVLLVRLKIGKWENYKLNKQKIDGNMDRSYD